MRRFLASAWFPCLTALVMIVVGLAMHVWLPRPLDVTNQDLIKAFDIAGWAVGPVIAVLTLVLTMILNGLRRLLKLRQIGILHPIVMCVAIAPWLIWGWELVMIEPHNTEFASAAIGFVGRPMFLAAFAALCFTVLVSLLTLLLPSKTVSPKRS